MMNRTLFAVFLAGVLVVLATSALIGVEAMTASCREGQDRLERQHVESRRRDREALEKVYGEIRHQWQLDRRAENEHRREERKLRRQELDAMAHKAEDVNR